MGFYTLPWHVRGSLDGLVVWPGVVILVALPMLLIFVSVLASSFLSPRHILKHVKTYYLLHTLGLPLCRSRLLHLQLSEHATSPQSPSVDFSSTPDAFQLPKDPIKFPPLNYPQ